jgi:hypothetical protein
MIITQREFSQAMAQVNVAFEVANDKIDKLEAEVKALTKEKANGNAKKGQSKSCQAGKAKGGGPRVKPGTSKGDSYCARSLGIKKGLPKAKQNDPNTPNNLSRKRWKCSGAKSKK